MAITATPEFQVWYESLGYGVTAIPGEVDVIVPAALLPPYIEGVEVGTGANIGGVDTGEKIVFHGVRHNIRNTFTHASGPDWDIADYESFQYLVTTKIARVRAPDGSYIFHAYRGSPGTNNLEAAKAQINIMRAEVGLAPVSTTTTTTTAAPTTATGLVIVKVNAIPGNPLFSNALGLTLGGVPYPPGIGAAWDGDSITFDNGSVYSWRNTILPAVAPGYVTIIKGLGTTTPTTTPTPTGKGSGVLALAGLALGALLLAALLAPKRRRA